MSFYSKSLSSRGSSYGGGSDSSQSDGKEDIDRAAVLEDSSLSTLNSSPGSAPSFGDSFNSRGDSNHTAREREDENTSENYFGANVSDFEESVSNGSSEDNESMADTSTVAGSSMKVSSDESEQEDDEDTSTEEEEGKVDEDSVTGIESTSQSTLQSSEEGASLPDPVGLKQSAAFLTQIMGDFQQRGSHAIPTKGEGIDQPHMHGEKDDSNGMMQAVRSGDMDLLREQLRRQQHCNITDSNHRTLLHVACSLGRLKMVQLFIEMGMDIDACSLAGQTPLHEACIGGHYRILQRLLSEVSDLDAVDSNGLSAAHYCALNGEVRCLDLLCDQGCDICLEDEFGRTGVHLAALHDHTDVIVCLMERGMELDSQDKQGKTPVHYAAQHGCLSSLAVLVKNAVDITSGDESGLQPVHEAVCHNQLDCLKFLIRKGVKSTAVDNQKRNSVHMAAHNGALDCLHWLLENGANPNISDSQGFTGLHHAASGGHAECFHCLLSHGAEPSISSLSGDNALDVARKRGKPRIIGKAIDGTKCCSMCVEKAAKEKLEGVGKSSPIHKKLQHSKGALFLHPIPATIGQHDRNLVGSPKRTYKSKNTKTQQGSTPRAAVLPKRNLAAKYYGPVL